MANGNVKGDAISITEQPGSLRRKIEQMRRFSVGNLRQTKDITDAYTLIDGDAGFLLLFTSATDENITVPATLPEGWWCACVQLGAGKATFVAASGATVNSLASAAATAGQYGGALVEVVANSDGASASAVVTPELDISSLESAVTVLEAAVAALEALPPAGLVSLTTVTVSTAVASVDFEGIPINDYDAFEIRVSGIVPASDANLLLRTRRVGQGSFDSGASDYAYGANGNRSSAGAFDANSAGATDILLTNIGTAAGESGSGLVRLSGLASTTLRKPVSAAFVATDQNGEYRNQQGGGAYIGSTEAIDAVRFIMSTGNIEAGTFDLFGIKGA